MDNLTSLHKSLFFPVRNGEKVCCPREVLKVSVGESLFERFTDTVMVSTPACRRLAELVSLTESMIVANVRMLNTHPIDDEEV